VHKKKGNPLSGYSGGKTPGDQRHREVSRGHQEKQKNPAKEKAIRWGGRSLLVSNSIWDSKKLKSSEKVNTARRVRVKGIAKKKTEKQERGKKRSFVWAMMQDWLDPQSGGNHGRKRWSAKQ